jgi:hypothetical protein
MVGEEIFTNASIIGEVFWSKKSSGVSDFTLRRDGKNASIGS